MVKAIINGIEVSGTPQEIWDYQQLVSKAQEVISLKPLEPIKDIKTFIGDGPLDLVPKVTSVTPHVGTGIVKTSIGIHP